ncbi:MAG: amidohydrolase [Oscillospiraceae bacterium]|nr:amidohydrolase [Oscillospiraceae bacterium]
MKRANELKDEAIAIRRDLHRIPEIGFELPQTTAYIKQKLTEYGCSYEEICKCGIVCNIGNGNGKTILIRADIDALPNAELSGEPFAATNGYSHSCGHDIHNTSLLICAKMLKEVESEINGTVKLCFQPDEESIHGAIEMIERGVLENPHVDAAISMHTKVPFKTGQFNVAAGNYLCSSDIFKVVIHGKSSHGSAPEVGVDPINIASKVIDAVQTLQTREVNTLDPNVITFGSINGGDAPNIIPDTVTLTGTIRCFTRDARPVIKERFVQIIEQVAALYRGSAEVEFTSQTPITYNDEALAADITRYLTDMVGAEWVSTEASGAKGSDDFAYFSDVVPGVMYHVGMGLAEDGYNYTLHNPRVRFDENALPHSAAAFAEITTRWLQEHK